MSLGIYLSADPAEELSADGERTKPFSISFEGTAGGTKEVKLYVRNDDSLFYYTGIELGLEDLAASSHIDGTLTGFSWKLSAGDLKPTLNDWAHITAGDDISLSNLGSSGTPNTSTYLPFWLQITVPANTSIQTIDTISFVLTATESSI